MLVQFGSSKGSSLFVAGFGAFEATAGPELPRFVSWECDDGGTFRHAHCSSERPLACNRAEEAGRTQVISIFNRIAETAAAGDEAVYAKQRYRVVSEPPN